MPIGVGFGFEGVGEGFPSALGAGVFVVVMVFGGSVMQMTTPISVFSARWVRFSSICFHDSGLGSSQLAWVLTASSRARARKKSSSDGVSGARKVRRVLRKRSIAIFLIVLLLPSFPTVSESSRTGSWIVLCSLNELKGQEEAVLGIYIHSWFEAMD